MIVIKQDGRRQAFERRKLETGMLRAGVPEKEAGRIAKMVESEINGDEIPSGHLRDRVVRHLHELGPHHAKNFSEFQKTVRRMVQGETDVENRLRQLVGETGTVQAVYGGFHIRVRKEDEFDWVGVLRTLVKAGLNIGVEVRDEKLIIVCK